MSGAPPYPTNRILLIPDDARWRDWAALRIVLREIRLHRRFSVKGVAVGMIKSNWPPGMKVTRDQLRHWEEIGVTVPPEWVLKEWARFLGYRLFIDERQELPYRLEKRFYSQR